MCQIKDAGHSINFSTSCAFVALHLMSTSAIPEVEHSQQSPMREMVLLGSAQLLGLLIERAKVRGDALEEKIQRAELEVKEMKKQRTEDAKANEKVVSIFSSHEQSWIAERKRLKLQIQSLAVELHTIETVKEEVISSLNERVMEVERSFKIKDEAVKEEVAKSNELELKLRLAEEAAEEWTERTKKEAQDHSSELRKHKTAFAELVSNQRQLEAEMGRAIRQAEGMKRDLDELFERKEEAVSMVEKLSDEIVKMEKDADQKDKILSAMLRKSKIDAAEKQIMLKEMKMSKAKKKQAELEMEKLRNMLETRHKKNSRTLYAVEGGCSQDGREELQVKGNRFNLKTILLEYLGTKWEKQHESSEVKGENIITTVHCLDQYSSDGRDELVPDDNQELQDWVRSETEKYATTLEQRHFMEIEAFSEQMRLKDEKLEALHWQILSMEIESKRLKSHVEGFEEALSLLREENMKLESLLLDREVEIKSLKEHFSLFVSHYQRSNSTYYSTSLAFDPQALWLEIRLRNRKLREKEQDTKAYSGRTSGKAESKNPDGVKQFANGNRTSEDGITTTTSATTSVDSRPPTNDSDDKSIICINEISLEEAESIESSSQGDANNISLLTLPPKSEAEEEKEVNIHPVHAQMHIKSYIGDKTATKLALGGQPFSMKETPWKMDIHALGVSYKIKRLKQQLLMLEKLTGMTHISTKEEVVDGANDRIIDENKQGLLLVMSLLNRQVKRFQSLEEKTDELCRRMHENSRGGSRGDSQEGRIKQQSRILETFLEETFQVQRYMVAAGQKLVDIQSKITSNFSMCDVLDESAGFNTRQFADVIRNLFKEIHRGLEVRIARIIGDLEGTLTCNGISQM